MSTKPDTYSEHMTMKVAPLITLEVERNWQSVSSPSLVCQCMKEKSSGPPECVRLQFEQNTNSYGELGSRLWPESLVLSRFIERSFCHGFWANKKVLELGAGIGQLGIVAAALGADVMMTDIAECLPLMSRNCGYNSSVCPLPLHLSPLRWGSNLTASIWRHSSSATSISTSTSSSLSCSSSSSSSLSSSSPSSSSESHNNNKPEIDIILGAAILYHARNDPAPLLHTLCQLCSPHTQIFICFPEDRRDASITVLSHAEKFFSGEFISRERMEALGLYCDLRNTGNDCKETTEDQFSWHTCFIIRLQLKPYTTPPRVGCPRAFVSSRQLSGDIDWTFGPQQTFLEFL